MHIKLMKNMKFAYSMYSKATVWKLAQGLGNTLKDSILAILIYQPLSLNIDESHADNRMLAIMVNYFNPPVDKMGVELHFS